MKMLTRDALQASYKRSLWMTMISLGNLIGFMAFVSFTEEFSRSTGAARPALMIIYFVISLLAALLLPLYAIDASEGVKTLNSENYQELWTDALFLDANGIPGAKEKICSIVGQHRDLNKHEYRAIRREFSKDLERLRCNDQITKIIKTCHGVSE